MPQPLKVNAGNNLQTMSVAETDYMVYRMGTTFASTDTGTGSVQVNPADTTGLTLIGTFTDTTRQNAVGTHPVGTSVNSTTYNFYQDRRSYGEGSLEVPLEYNTSSGNIEQQSTAVINSTWIDRAQDTIVAMGSNAVGCYVLQPTAPSDGTWIAKGTITNSLIDGTTNNTYLWRKTAAASAPTDIKPVKYTGSNIQVFTDAEINAWHGRLRNQIKDGIGQYQLSASAPTSGGTWAAAGSAFVDTRKQVGNVTYVGTSSATFAGSYTGNFTGSYTGNYTGSYQIFYAGTPGPTYSGTYAGSYTGTYSSSFTGYYTAFYTGYYQGLTVLSSDETVSSMTLWVRTA